VGQGKIASLVTLATVNANESDFFADRPMIAGNCQRTIGQWQFPLNSLRSSLPTPVSFLVLNWKRCSESCQSRVRATAES
jgi:hypothetical protein